MVVGYKTGKMLEQCGQQKGKAAGCQGRRQEQKKLLTAAQSLLWGELSWIFQVHWIKAISRIDWKSLARETKQFQKCLK